MALYDASGNIIPVGGGSVNVSGSARNVFDISQNTEENAYLEHDQAFHHPTQRSWGGAGDYAGAYFSYLIPVKPGEIYYLQNIHRVSGDNNATAIFYTAAKELTTERYALTAAGNAITIPATAAYMRIPVHADTVDTVMALKDATEPASVFVPYDKQIVPGLYGEVGTKGIAFDKLDNDARFHRFIGAKAGCLGDSLTNMATNGWIKRLKELMGFASITNYGMSGTTVTSARGEGENTYRDRAPNMAEDLDLIIVMTSINDYGAEIGVYNPTEKTGTLEDATDKTVNDVSTIAGAGLELVRILREKYPYKDIVFFSNPHPEWGEWCYQAAEMYRTICARNTIPFFDMLAYSGIYGGKSGEATHFYIDSTHMSDAGNDRIADFMAASLRTL